MKKSIVMLVMVPVLFLAGCTAATYEYTSTPVAGTIATQAFEATFTPKKNGTQYFNQFQVDITNLSKFPLEIDWNNTAYLLNGKKNGRVVWAGIAPATVREGKIPYDVVAPGTSLTRKISPLTKVAISQRKDRSAGKDKTGLYAGILPAGENGILLTLKNQGQTVLKKMTVVIAEEKK
ncbi:MAG TPA: hypothetical protein DHV36_02195 [Desulfobacteraceae bacterium]|nr:hypothetical protein [Desulfobacteraceae bacterium]